MSLLWKAAVEAAVAHEGGAASLCSETVLVAGKEGEAGGEVGPARAGKTARAQFPAAGGRLAWPSLLPLHCTSLITSAGVTAIARLIVHIPSAFVNCIHKGLPVSAGPQAFQKQVAVSFNRLDRCGEVCWMLQEKRKRELGQAKQDKNYVEEEKRLARGFGIHSGFDQ